MKGLIAGILMAIFAEKSFSLGFLKFGYHVTYKLVSDPFVWQLSEQGDFENERLKDYYADDTLFVCDNDDFYHRIFGEDIKNNQLPSHFCYTIYTKHREFKYDINKIKVKTEDGEYDLLEHVYRFYPKDGVYVVPFEQSEKRGDYFRSRYFVGWYKIPCPKNKKFSVVVDLTYEFDGTKKSAIFKYDYEVKRGFSFVRYVGP